MEFSFFIAIFNRNSCSRDRVVEMTELIWSLRVIIYRYYYLIFIKTARALQAAVVENKFHLPDIFNNILGAIMTHRTVWKS